MRRSARDEKPENSGKAARSRRAARSASRADPSASHRDTPALAVDNLCVVFPARSSLLGRGAGEVHAVSGVSFILERGETLGLVGESGCGKSTLARAVLRLIQPCAGRVLLFGRDVSAGRAGALRRLRRDMQIVFQDPGGSLSPRMRVGAIVAEPIRVHSLARDARDAARQALALLERCGLPADAAGRLPHELSGGQRQRVAIARALATGPRFLVLDEPTAALDVSVQAHILNLISDLQRDLGLSCLFISHDMSVIGHMCPRIAVMQAGRIVEMGTREQTLGAPREEYTRRLLAAVPRPDPSLRTRPAAPPAGHVGTT
jgi:ABC-type glutathione transport system ATPase component